MNQRILAALAASFAAIVLWNATRPQPLEFEAWPPAPALRTVAGGPATAGGPVALIGLDSDARGSAAPPTDLCRALFEDKTAEDVPIAFFTDHYCPNCRSMAETLSATKGVTIVRHELPILGPDSLVAARAALAASLQGAEDAFHQRLRRTAFSPTEAYLGDVADGMGLDAERLLTDMEGEEVAAMLDRGGRLATSLGFFAVPTTVLGRTVVTGDLPPSRVSRIVEAERRAGSPCPLGR